MTPDTDPTALPASVKQHLRGLKDSTIRIEGTFKASGGIPHPKTTASVGWSRLPGAAGAVAYLLTAVGLIAVTYIPSERASLVILLVLCGIGILACAVAAAIGAKKATARYLRSLALKRGGPDCTVDSPCDVCRGVKSWDATNSAGSTATPGGGR